ncbi:MAG: cyclase family protein [Thermoproteus sp.]|jgi:kynurenine formamidase|nr:cyclase family protein [Thermoproteus sp.]
MKVIDLSRELRNGMQVFPGDPPYRHEYVDFARRYGEVTLSKIEMGTHNGTHVDAPAHFVPDGDTLERIPAGRFVAHGSVLDLSWKRPGEAISASDLGKFGDKIARGRAVMIYTGFSSRYGTEEFLYNWPYLDRSAADYLAGAGVAAVGVEGMSVAGYAGAEGYPYPPRVSGDDVVYVHYRLLSSGVVIIENLTNLDAVLRECGGEALFVYAPIKIGGGEGGPARVLAIC